MTEVILRPATKRDAADLALLDNIAGHGISLWFWQREVKTGLIEDALALGRMRLSQEEAFYGVPNAIIAEHNDDIVGAVTAYEMPPADEESQQIKRNAPAFAPLFELFDRASGDWFIDSLAVYPQSRGQGIGQKLLQGAMKKGQDQKHKTATLIVEDNNTSALNLYENYGFEYRETRPFVEFRGPSETKQWIMLSKQLS